MHTPPTVDGFMSKALHLAYKNLGNVSPNPSVGALIAKENKILSEGITQPPGGNHAEIEAIKNYKDPRGAVLYTTLEPCSHTNKRTSPCTKAIIESGISGVVIATRDQNPQVNGKGIQQLEAAGIKVTCGILEQEAQKMHEFFFHYIKTKTPFVAIKSAQTLNGSMTWGNEKRKKISSLESLKKSHELRSKYDAILVGINTILNDDPQLTCRLVPGKNPIRVILDSDLKIPPSAKILNEGKVIIFYSKDANKEKMKNLSKISTLIPIDKDQDGLSLKQVLHELGNRNITSLLIEGGPTIIASFLNQRLAQKIMSFVSPTVRSGRGFYDLLNEKSLRLHKISAHESGSDILLEGYL